MGSSTTYDVLINYKMGSSTAGTATGIKHIATQAERASKATTGTATGIKKVAAQAERASKATTGTATGIKHIATQAERASKATTGTATGIKEVAAQAERASKATDGLKDAFAALGVVGGVAGIAAAGKRAFIDFNSSVEQSTISLAAQEKMLLGGKWSTAMEHATGLFKHYQDVAKASVGTTQDFLTMHQAIAASAYRGGLGMEQIKKMTTGAVIAGQVLGERADIVALDIKQMLAGTIGARDRVAQMLIASLGKSQEQFNRATQKERSQMVLKALTDPAIAAAAKQMEGSFAGVTSTLKDNLSIALGKVGMPLFKAITAEIKGWNDWIDKSGSKMGKWGAQFSGALMKGLGFVKSTITSIYPLIQDAFGLVKSVGGFMVQHQELLVGLLKAFLVFKGISLVAGAAGGLAGGVAKLTSSVIDAAASMKTGTAGAAQGFGALAGTLFGTTGAIAGIAALAVGAFALSAYLLSESKKERRKREESENVSNIVGDYRRGRDEIARLEKDRETRGVKTYHKEWDVIEGKISEAKARMERGKQAILESADVKSLVGMAVRPGEGTAYQLRKDLLEDYKREQDRRYAAGEIKMDDLTRAGTLVWGLKQIFSDLKAGTLLIPLEKKEEKEDDRKKNLGQPKVNVTINKIEVASADPDRFVMGIVSAVEHLNVNPTQSLHALRGF